MGISLFCPQKTRADVEKPHIGSTRTFHRLVFSHHSRWKTWSCKDALLTIVLWILLQLARFLHWTLALPFWAKTTWNRLSLKGNYSLPIIHFRGQTVSLIFIFCDFSFFLWPVGLKGFCQNMGKINPLVDPFWSSFGTKMFAPKKSFEVWILNPWIVTRAPVINNPRDDSSSLC